MGKFILGSLLMLLSLPAQAGWMVEPYLGYESGVLVQKDTADIDLSGKTTMTTTGIRAGYKFPRGIWLTADYMSGFGGKFTYDNTANGTTSKTNKYDLGVTFGYDHNNRYRMYAGYIVGPAFRMVDEAVGGQENFFLNGSSWKIGVGGLWGSWFAFCVEYYSNSPTKYKNDSGTFSLSDINNKFVETGYRLVMSFPLSLTK